MRSFGGKDVEFVLDGVLAASTVNLITGESGSGKTTLVSAICDAVRQGKPFAGLATSKRRVLMLDRENSRTVVCERFDRLGIVDSNDFTIWGGWETEGAWGPNSAVIVDWVKSCDPKPLLVFDPLIAFNEGDENSAKDTRRYFQHFRNLANLGATVIVIYHSGKAETLRILRKFNLELRGKSTNVCNCDCAECLAGDCADCQGMADTPGVCTDPNCTGCPCQDGMAA